MKNVILLITFVLSFGIALIAADVPKLQVQDPQHEFAGLDRCKMCHRGDRNGNIFEKWEASPHAKAYETLASEKSKEVYAKLGKTGNPQEDPSCLKCHITGWGVDTKFTEKVKLSDGLSCESCHFAGADYWKKSIMENREEAIKQGLNPSAEKSCVGCHNEESPTYKEFEYDKFWKEIEHKIPAK